MGGRTGQDGGGGGDEGGGVDGSSGSEVSRHSDTLEDLRETEESGNGRVGEGVVASLNRGGSSSSEGTWEKRRRVRFWVCARRKSQRTGKEGDVVGLISGDTLEGRVDVGVTGGGEIGGGVSGAKITKSETVREGRGSEARRTEPGRRTY